MSCLFHKPNQTKEEKKKNSCMLLPNVTNNRFHIFVTSSFSCHFCNPCNCCYNKEIFSSKPSEFWASSKVTSLSHLSTPLQKGYEAQHNKSHHVLQLWKKVFVMSFPAHIYRSTLSQTIRAETWVHTLKKMCQHREKVILPSFKMYTGLKQTARGKLMTWRYVFFFHAAELKPF